MSTILQKIDGKIACMLLDIDQDNQKRMKIEIIDSEAKSTHIWAFKGKAQFVSENYREGDLVSFDCEEKEFNNGRSYFLLASLPKDAFSGQEKIRQRPKYFKDDAAQLDYFEHMQERGFIAHYTRMHGNQWAYNFERDTTDEKRRNEQRISGARKLLKLADSKIEVRHHR